MTLFIYEIMFLLFFHSQSFSNITGLLSISYVNDKNIAKIKIGDFVYKDWGVNKIICNLYSEMNVRS